VELAKGANAVVRGRVARVSLRSRLPTGTVDLFALELTGGRRVRDDGDLVFYNQRRSADGCLWLVDERCVRVALDDLAAEVSTVVVAAGLDDGWPGSFADDLDPVVQVEEAGESAWDGPDTTPWAVRHRVEAEGDERCVVLVELYRRAGEWKVRAVSQGWTAGTVALLTEHGVHLDQEAALETPAAPAAAAGSPVRRAAGAAGPEHALPPTLPEVAVRAIPPTRPFPLYPWRDGDAYAAEAPTEIVASPTGAWPVWRRRPEAPAVSGRVGRVVDGPSGGGTRHLRVAPVARASSRDPLDLNAMDPYDFEQLVADLMTKMGYRTERVGRSGDGGVDVEVRSDDPLAAGLIVISVKRYKRTVGAHYVRELAGTVADRGAIKGILVTTSGFGPTSYEFAAKNRLELVDGDRLRAWLAEYLRLETI